MIDDSVRHMYLVRHAKSSWEDPSIPDHDRPLAPRGTRAAARIARYVAARGIHPQLVVCSSAKRARQTLDALVAGLGDGVEVRIEESLYGATAEELLERLRAVPTAIRSVMLIGHNPGVQDLASLIAGDDRASAKLGAKFPTGALATLEVTGVDWANVESGSAALVDFVTPKRLA